MLINSPNISGSLTVTGNSVISGSLNVLGSITGAITGSATTASYVEYTNVANKPALVSGSSQITYSGLTGIPSGIVSGSSQVSFNGITDKPTLVSGSSQITYSGLTGIPSGIVSGSIQIADFGIFATTGSNGFNGSQSITGSLTVTGQVVAQTLNVQQVTSSIVYSSGSNVFGNSLANTQQFTGSVSVTGSFTVAGAGTFSNTLTLNGSNNVIRSGNELRFNRADNAIYTRLYDAGSLAANGFILDNTNGEGFHFQNNGTTIMRMNSSGNVGIGTTSPNAKLRIQNDNSTIPSLIVRDGGTPTANLIEATSNAYGNSFILSATGIATFAGTTVAANGSINIESTDPAIRFRYTGGTANSRIYEWRAVAAGGVNDIMQLRLWNDAQSSATTLFTVSPTGAGIFSSTVTATRGFFSSNAASDSTTGLLANATTNDSSTYAAIFGSLNAGYRMVVRADGNVGIGNTSPQGLLQIGSNALSNNTDASNAFNLKQTSTTAATGIYLERSGERKGYYMYMGGSLDSLTFQRNNAGTKADVMSLTRDGNVGIENDSPVTKLTLGSYSGARLPYINGTGATFSANGITVTSANSGNAAIGGGLDLTNNTYSVNSYSPILSFSSRSSNGTYNNSYAGIWGVLGGQGGDANWVVGALVFGTASSYGINERVRITSDGRVGIGVTNPEAGLQVALPGADDQLILGSAANNRDHAAFIYSGSNKAEFLRYQSASRLIIGSSANISNLDVIPGGSVGVRLSAGNTSWSAFTSDERRKKNFETVPGLEAITQINPVKYHFKTQEDSEVKKLGFIAQNLQPLIPEMVHPNGEKAEDGSDILTIIPDYILPVLVKAIQELKAENDTLKSRIDTLEQA